MRTFAGTLLIVVGIIAVVTTFFTTTAGAWLAVPNVLGGGALIGVGLLVLTSGRNR